MFNCPMFHLCNLHVKVEISHCNIELTDPNTLLSGIHSANLHGGIHSVNLHGGIHNVNLHGGIHSVNLFCEHTTWRYS